MSPWYTQARLPTLSLARVKLYTTSFLRRHLLFTIVYTYFMYVYSFVPSLFCYIYL